MYPLIASLFAALGAVTLVAPRAGIWLFLAAVLALPSSSAFDSWDYRFGLYGFDFFFLVLLVTHPLRVLMRPRAPWLSRDFVALLGLLLLGAMVLIASERELDKYVLRDLRPYLLVAEGLVLLAFLQNSKVQFSDRAVLLLGVAAGVSCFVGFALIHFGVHEVDDPFHDENWFRYWAIGTYLSAVLLVWLSGAAGRLFWAAPFLTICASAATAAAVLLSGVRTLVVATAVACVVAGRLRLGRVLFGVAVGGLLIVGLAAVSAHLEIERVTSATTTERIAGQLASRFGPAMDVASEMTWWQWVVGSGAGTTFDIPWFESRSLDPRNNYVDSTYITLLVKFGLSAVAYGWLLIRAFGVGRAPPGVSRGVLACLAILGGTMAIPYQKHAVGFLLAGAILSRSASAPARLRRAPPGATGAARTPASPETVGAQSMSPFRPSRSRAAAPSSRPPLRRS